MWGLRRKGDRIKVDVKTGKTRRTDTKKVKDEGQRNTIKQTEQFRSRPTVSRTSSRVKSDVPLQIRRETATVNKITPDKVAKDYKKGGK